MINRLGGLVSFRPSTEKEDPSIGVEALVKVRHSDGSRDHPASLHDSCTTPRRAYRIEDLRRFSESFVRPRVLPGSRHGSVYCVAAWTAGASSLGHVVAVAWLHGRTPVCFQRKPPIRCFWDALCHRIRINRPRCYTPLTRHYSTRIHAGAESRNSHCQE